MINATTYAKYFERVEKAHAAAFTVHKTHPDLFLTVLLAGVEEIVHDLAKDLEAHGCTYSTPNECWAIARACLWAGWVSWILTAKSQREDGPDLDAKRLDPIARDALASAIEAGVRIGANGGRPESFVP